MKHEEKGWEQNSDEKIKQSLITYIKKGKYTIDDVKMAYMNEVNDTNRELVGKIQQALDNNFPMNKVAEIIEEMEKEQHKKEEIDKKINEYLEKIYSVNFDRNSLKFLREFLDYEKNGECVFTVNGELALHFTVRSDSDVFEKMKAVLGRIERIKKYGNQYSLGAYFVED